MDVIKKKDDQNREKIERLENMLRGIFNDILGKLNL